MRRIPLRASALLLGASVALGACGSDDDDAPDDVGGGTQAPGSVVDDPAGEGAGEPPGTESGGDPSPNDPEPGSDPGEEGEDPDASGQGDASTDPGTGTPPGGGGEGSATVSRVGGVTFSQTGGPEGGEATAGALFLDLGRALPIEPIEAGLTPPADTCTVGRLETGPPRPGGVDIPDLGGADVNFVPIEAGETIVVTSPAGTYATLVLLTVRDLAVYAPEEGGDAATVPFPVPSGLVVDIPGADFPAFSGVAVPDVAPLTGVSPTGTADENDRFVWDAAGGEAHVEIELDFYTAQPALRVTCSAIDDGEFELPQSVRDEIPDGLSGLPSVTRVASRFERGDGALLIVRNEASES